MVNRVDSGPSRRHDEPMQTLPETFDGRADQRGYQFKQIKRTGLVALFEKRNPDHPPGTLPAYEVVIVRKVAERRFPNGIVTPAHESMPSPEEWGTSGWSPATLEAAHTRFNALVASR